MQQREMMTSKVQNDAGEMDPVDTVVTTALPKVSHSVCE